MRIRVHHSGLFVVYDENTGDNRHNRSLTVRLIHMWLSALSAVLLGKDYKAPNQRSLILILYESRKQGVGTCTGRHIRIACMFIAINQDSIKSVHAS